MSELQRKDEQDFKRKIRNDVILIIVILAVVLAVFLTVYFTKREGTYVSVTVDGRHYATYSLSEDREVIIKNPLSSEYVNKLVIKDGKAYVSEANCRDGICSSHRPVHINGESIVCLPHKLVVTVVSEAEEVDMVG